MREVDYIKEAYLIDGNPKKHEKRLGKGMRKSWRISKEV